jgi:hypothetical protein
MKFTMRSGASLRNISRLILGGISCAVVFAAACAEDERAAACTGGEGAVMAEGEGSHCRAEDGSARVQVIGACISSATSGMTDDHEHDAGDEAPIHTGRNAIDDDCKYSVHFENTCVAAGQAVTLTLSLTRSFDGQPGSGAVPRYPEIFMADDVAHISPSNDITATEAAPGTYEIGPVLFDASGRWVVRFHYFETCNDLTPDSPHGHVAFYVDVP